MEILIIGGIAAGMSAAAKALRTNKKANITVVEQENYISFGACALPYYVGRQFEEESKMYARTPQQMQDAGINILIKHKALAVDFENKKVEILDLKTNQTIFKKYDRLMIATGAVAKDLPISNTKAANVYTITKPYIVNKLIDRLDQYQNIVVVGGGFIGVEVSEQLAHLNKNVTLLQSSEYVMNQPYDSEFSEKIKMALEKAGVLVQTNSRAQEFIVENNLVNKVITESQEYPVDALIIAVGIKPNTKFLNKQLKTMENGAILINEYGETSIKDVFAAGDCASVLHRLAGDQYIPLATYANKLGRLIGTNIVSDKKDWLAFEGGLGSSAIKIGDYEAVTTGLTETMAKDLAYDIKTTLIETKTKPGYYPGQETITIKLVYDAKTFVLYGAQMFGKEDVVIRASGLTTAIHAGLTTKEIGFIDYAYSPPFATTWDALNIAANTAK